MSTTPLRPSLLCLSRILPLVLATLFGIAACHPPRGPLVIQTAADGQILTDTAGHPVTRLRYQKIHPLSDGIYRVERRHRYGFLDSLGRTLVKPQYSYAEDFHHGLAIVYNAKTGRASLINRRGATVTDQVYDWIGRLYAYDAQDNPHYLSGRYLVRSRGLFALLGPDGRLVTPLCYDLFPCAYFEGLSPVHRDSRWGFIDTLGHEVISPHYDSVGLFACGLAPVCQHGLWGFVDHRDSLVVPLRYQSASHFSQRRAAVKRAGRWGFVDPSGREIIPPQFDDTIAPHLPPLLGFRSDGTARLIFRRRPIVIDTLGRPIQQQPSPTAQYIEHP